MNDKVYQLIKAICFIIIACSSVLIAMEISEINEKMRGIVSLMANE